MAGGGTVLGSLNDSDNCCLDLRIWFLFQPCHVCVVLTQSIELESYR